MRDRRELQEPRGWRRSETEGEGQRLPPVLVHVPCVALRRATGRELGAGGVRGCGDWSGGGGGVKAGRYLPCGKPGVQGHVDLLIGRARVRVGIGSVSRQSCGLQLQVHSLRHNPIVSSFTPRRIRTLNVPPARLIAPYSSSPHCRWHCGPNHTPQLSQ